MKRKPLMWALVLGVAAFAIGRAQRMHVFESARTFVAAQQGNEVPPEDDAQEPAGALHGGARLVQERLPPAPDGPEIRVLFLGNSLTYSWGMPQMLIGLARTAGINLVTDQHTPGGYSLQQQDTTSKVKAMLGAGSWNFVVLQDQSALPTASDAELNIQMDPPVKALAQRARTASPTVRVVLYMTPARKDGLPPSSGYQGMTYEAMQSRVNDVYRRLANEVSGMVAPAGVAWQRARETRPDIALYADDRHPTEAGAYLIACVFLGAVLERNPVGSSYVANLQPDLAYALQRIAWQAVLEERAR